MNWNSTLTRKTPMKRTAFLSTAVSKSIKQKLTREIWSQNGTFKRVKPIKKISKSLRNRQRTYFELQHEFLMREENANCCICIARRERGENIPLRAAVEVHHWAGRTGRLLCYVPYFRASCFSCRSFPHDHPTLAREMGILAPAALWNVFPPEK